MIKPTLLALAAAIATLAAVPAVAQNTPAAPAAPASAAAASVSPAKRELVQKVLRLQQPAVEALGNAVAMQTSNQILAAAGQGMGRVAADKREAVGKEIQADVRKFYEELSPLLRERAQKLAPEVHGPLLEQRFTEDELRQLVTWLESPASRKYAELSGEMQGGLVQRLAADTRGNVEPKLRALEQSIAKKLGVPAASAASAPAPAKKK